MTIEEFKETCDNFFRLKYKGEIDGKLIFWYRGKEELQISIEAEKLEILFAESSNYEVYSETELHNDKYYEVPISFDSFSPIRRFENIEKVDTVNDLEYILGLPSDRYVVFLIEQLKDFNRRDFMRMGSMFNSSMLNRMFSNEEDKPEFLTFISMLLPRFRTLIIKSNSPKKISEFENLCYSFIFNLSYNLDASFLPLRFIEEISRKIRIGRIRRSNVEDIETPKRKYNNDLILYYQRGVSSESIDNQFLSFYHVMEHFFEKVYQDDIINSIKGELTKPSFSYKRNRDINQLVKVIKKKLIYTHEEFSIKSEQSALLLTLQKFILDTEEIKDKIVNFDSTLIDYYKTNVVSFSNGDKVDFTMNDVDKILGSLSKRIYKTRNAIVHSKESEHSKYLPYKNDKELIKEIFLMRVLAEKIIIKSSSEL